MTILTQDCYITAFDNWTLGFFIIQYTKVILILCASLVPICSCFYVILYNIHMYICICLHYVLIFTDLTVLQNCKITSPSTGTITISCDSPYQILVNCTCVNNCNNPMVAVIGNSPLTVRGLDPGMM